LVHWLDSRALIAAHYGHVQHAHTQGARVPWRSRKGLIGMQCPQCGTSVKPTAIFCQRCGKRLAARPADAPTPPRVLTLPVAPPDLPGAASDVHATQPVPLARMARPTDAPAPPDAGSGDALADVAGAETREFAFAPAVEASDQSLEQPYDVHSPEVGDMPTADDVTPEDRCWSCGAPWADGDDDRFCEQCGAQRRGKRSDTMPETLAVRADAPAGQLAPSATAGNASQPGALGIDGAATRVMETIPAKPGNFTITVSSDDTVALMAASPLLAPDASLRLPPLLDLPVSAPEPHPAAMTVPPMPLMGGGPDAFALSSGQSDAPTVEATYFEVTTFLPGFVPGWHIRMGVQSDVGQARRGRPNEDSSIAMTLSHAGDNAPPPLTLGVVADGLGGHEDGQRAGRIAARTVARYVMQHLWLPALAGEATPPKDPAQLGTILRAAIQEANAHILKINRHEGGDMGCTVTALIAQGEAACIANVGDSRTYLFDGHVLSRVTTDHSLVARLVAAGMLTPDEVYSHPQRSQIYRSLGDDSDIQVDLFPHRLRVGETFVLCSDGLWEMVRDPEIERLLARSALGDPHALAHQLIEMANANGGDDNVSVLVAQVVA
jgi:serine/threonine protein phosphatase PrpC